ncbi:hypothetical protein J2Z76_000450 [Sedimentibacter acidaminivorans]|uniref:Uncharacterized protein n=1 Tax=Sedimentibacter acidaminivorans TaxID=913099 RepID=A0ABS4GAN4_9FIRM|nr:hypothetical protein [Sedimentibacter acidaminivorans]MBP1924597.1 hypothetical protein [Sedimentibacter acidaminivorans]
MNFKDVIAADIDNVFFNSNEFAEEITIDGTKTNIVMDSDLLKELQLSNGGEGLANSELLFHVKKNDLKFSPFVGHDILFNEKLYYINNIQYDEGLYTIAIGVARS